jgi:hypothetical protein
VQRQSRRNTVLLVLLLLGVASTAVHFTDNYVSFESYPQPEWLTPAIIPVAWIVLTSFGLLGYYLYTSGRMIPAYVCLAVYSYTGGGTPGHYLYGSFSDFAPWRNASILLDGVLGIAILGFVLWSALIAQEWQGQPQRGPGRPLA